MSNTVNRGGVDPVDATGYGMTDRSDGVSIILTAPSDRPIATDGPGSKAYPSDVHIGQAELPDRKRFVACHCVPLVLSFYCKFGFGQ
jgi:hypothetical protein